MFTTKTIYKICFVLLGAVSVRGDIDDDGDCWVTPDIYGVVNIPDGTETIPELAFDNCDALKAVNIPASVQNIGLYSFSETENLETVIFEEGSLLEVIGFAVSVRPHPLLILKLFFAYQSAVNGNSNLRVNRPPLRRRLDIALA